MQYEFISCVWNMASIAEAVRLAVQTANTDQRSPKADLFQSKLPLLDADALFPIHTKSLLGRRRGTRAAPNKRGAFSEH